jgi:Prohead core protein serine protease
MDKTVQTGWIFFEPIGGMLNEANEDPSKPMIVQGVLQRANAKNQNGRVYPKDILEREVKKYDDNFVKERRALGELDHPDSSVVNLQNVSHNVVEMMWNGDDLVGKVEILPTPSGNILRALFKAGIKLGISSRGLGSVRKNVRENADEVQDDFELIAFDFVSNPSTRGAFLFPSGALNESVTPNIVNKYAKIESIIHDIISEVK